MLHRCSNAILVNGKQPSMNTFLKISISFTFLNIINCIENIEYQQVASYSTNPQNKYFESNTNVDLSSERQAKANIYEDINQKSNTENNNQYKSDNILQSKPNLEPQTYYIQVERSTNDQTQQTRSETYYNNQNDQPYVVSVSNQNSIPLIPPVKLQFTDPIAQSEQNDKYYESYVQPQSFVPRQEQRNEQQETSQFFQVQLQSENTKTPVSNYNFNTEPEQQRKSIQNTELSQNIYPNQLVSANSKQQIASYPAYQQVILNSEPERRKSSSYKVKENPVERQTEEYTPTSNVPYGGQHIIRDSSVFHDLAVHGQTDQRQDIFSSLVYNQNIQNHGSQQIQSFVQPQQQNTYDVFSDSLQGQTNMGLSAYRSPQQRFLNSGL